jgi:hypothetical protein
MADGISNLYKGTRSAPVPPNVPIFTCRLSYIGMLIHSMQQEAEETNHYVRKTQPRCARMKNGDAQIAHLTLQSNPRNASGRISN